MGGMAGKTSLLLIAATVASALSAVPTAQATQDYWPRWRGPEGKAVGSGSYPD